MGWFKDAVECSPQTVPYILPRMALTFADPNHRYALKGSCHQLATRFLRERDDQAQLKDDDRILQLGAHGTVYHTIIAAADNRVLYDSFRPSGPSGFKPDRGVYVLGDQGEIGIMSDISVADFKKNYVSRVVLPSPATGNDPSTP